MKPALNRYLKITAALLFVVFLAVSSVLLTGGPAFADERGQIVKAFDELGQCRRQLVGRDAVRGALPLVVDDGGGRLAEGRVEGACLAQLVNVALRAAQQCELP
jgi:hypothetical protein